MAGQAGAPATGMKIKSKGKSKSKGKTKGEGEAGKETPSMLPTIAMGALACFGALTSGMFDGERPATGSCSLECTAGTPLPPLPLAAGTPPAAAPIRL